MQVCNLTTPAQYFHVLRRQMKRAFRKPLVIMTPKSLLRADSAVSQLADFTTGGFEETIRSAPTGGAAAANKVILCSGKVYYDLMAKRDADKIADTAVVRLEQLYPLHVEKLKAMLAPYQQAKKWVWCQEEPKNMGAWTYISPRLAEVLPGPQPIYTWAARPARARLSARWPATRSNKRKSSKRHFPSRPVPSPL